MYDWIEIEVETGHDTTKKQVEILDNIRVMTFIKNFFNGVSWYNGRLNNPENDRTLDLSITSEGKVRIRVCPNKFLLDNNVQEASLKKVSELFQSLSALVGVDLFENAIVKKLDVTHTAITDYPPEAYFPHLCEQKGFDRWQKRGTLYFEKRRGSKHNTKKFYDKVAEVNDRKNSRGRQDMPEELEGKNLTRFEVCYTTNKKIAKAMSIPHEAVKLYHLFNRESVESLHANWIHAYTSIPKQTESEMTFYRGMGGKAFTDEVFRQMCEDYGRQRIEEHMQRADAMGVFQNREAKSNAKQKLLKAFKIDKPTSNLIQELNRKMLAFEPKWD